ncbi:MAG: hypothetical protein KGI24_04830 [Candidatus Omnitrophica bacterium]|nr:hypothetical protein [Candidatus Omnitrophota bacterium]MDE2214309.1 hypothetical protein [Candidatus Omnitrophota bacterium]MDE2231058.1 hypothetical protein [Candidatus Omnitrophota bacterium]
MGRLLFTMALLTILAMPQAWGYTKSPYPNPYRQTLWNDFTDSVHTLGQSPQQAKKTKETLHAQRVRTRLKDINDAEIAKFRQKRQAWVRSQEEQQP